MADARLRIVIDALNKAGDDLGKLKKDLQGVDKEAGKAEKSTGKFGGGLQSMMGKVAIATAAVAAVSAALKQVYQTAREGADLLYVEDRFNNLTAVIGTTSDALMNDLRVATRGLKSDAELMQGAMDFMSLGLAKSHDEVVRLTSVAGALGMNMNQLVLTLTNRTTMRFDALGVSVDGFDDKVKALEASGLSAEEAFGEAFLQQAEEQIEKVGHAADSTKGSFDRLEAGIKTSMDNIKKDTAKAVEPIIGWLADLTEGNNSFKEVKRQVDELYESHQITNTQWDELQRLLYNTAGGQEQVQHFLELFPGAADRSAQAAANYYDYVILADEANEGLVDSTSRLEGITLDAALAMQSYTEKLLFKMASEGLGSDEALALAEAMGLVDENTMFAASQMDLLRQRYDDGLISAEQYKDAVVALGGEIEKLQDKTITIDAKLNDPHNIKGWKLTDQKATYTVRTVRTETTREDRPTGGPVSANNPYLWQEYGYRGEVLVPSQNGYVLSRADAERIVAAGANRGGSQQAYAGPTADEIARAVRDGILAAGTI
jgi:uncharacterized protein YoxC